MNTKEGLLAELVTSGYLKTASIVEAFKKVDRADFVLSQTLSEAYENYPLPIGHGQTISQPLTVAFMLEQLGAKKGEKVLDVGFGSGWTTALLAQIVGKRGRVYGLEVYSEIYNFGAKNLQKYNFRNVKLFLRSGWEGLAEEAPFNRILVSASASEVPQALRDQLQVGGRMVIPIKDSIVILDKTGKNEFKTTEHWGFAFVPLVKNG